MRVVGRILVVGVLAAASSGAPISSSLTAGEPGKKADVRVALFTGAGCGTFADHLPELFRVSGLEIGDETPVVKVCVMNASAHAGDVTLRVVERVEREERCSADERAVDSTCGTGPGELGRSLLHLRGLDRRCGSSYATPVGASFAELESNPVLLFRDLRPKQPACVALRVRFQPADTFEAAAAATDTVTWRYAFDLMTAK